MKPMRALVGLFVACALSACTPSVEPPRKSAPVPESAPAPSASHRPRTGQQVVADPQSRLVQLAFGPGEARVSVWRWCTPETCRDTRYGITTSADAFETSHPVAIPTNQVLDVRSVGGGDFVVRRNYRLAWLLYSDGTMRRISVHGPTGPVQPEEVPVEEARGLFAVDTGSGIAHRVTTPPGLHEVRESYGRLSGTTSSSTGRSTLTTSDDGGATWRSTALPRRHALWMQVSGGPRSALIEGADGATLFPYLASWRLRSGSFQSTAGPTDPTAYVSCAHRLANGRLLVCVDDWSDHSKKPGFWVSTDRTWSDFEPVAPGRPFADDEVFQPVVVAERESRQLLTLVLSDPATGLVYATRDEGRHFRELAAR